MLELDFQPEMVGRDGELEELGSHLEKAGAGQGSTIFVSGEAGIGKTRLLQELKQVAKSRGFLVLSGTSMFESLTPYMPFMEALRSGGLESLFGEQAPRIEGVYLVSGSGLLIGEYLREATQLDSDIFASMLTSVGNFVKDTLSMMAGEEREGTLNVLGYEKYRIVIEAGIDANMVVVLTGEENEFLVSDMREILGRVEAGYGDVLKAWDGDKEPVKGIENLLKPLVASGKYDGIYYGKENPESRRFLLFENVSLGLRRRALARPMLLCIEDMQWVDPSTLALLQYVSRNTRRSRLLIVCTYRPEDIVAREGAPVHPLAEAMQLMGREELFEEVSLKRLSRESIDRLLSSLFRKAEFSDEFKDRLHRETEGNPLFVIELVKLLVTEDAIKMDRGTWRLVKEVEEVNVPLKIFDVIKRRLNRLREDETEVLDFAAVAGSEFTSDLLAKATGLGRVQLLRVLRRLEQTHRLIRSFDTRYRFDHTKIKEVLYNEMPLELRREYHSIIARSIEELHKDDLDAVVGDLAFHYYQCRDAEKAVPSLLRAAETAKKAFANTEAIRFYREALELIGNDRARSEERLRALEQLSEVHLLRGEYDRATSILDEMRAVSKDRNVIAKTYRIAGGVFEKRGEYDKALEELSRSASILGERETAEHGRISAFKAMVYVRKGDYDAGLKLCEEALRIYAGSVGADKDLAQVYNVMGILRYYKGEHAESLRNYSRAIEIREKIGDMPGVASCLINIGIVNHSIGDFAAAIDYGIRGLAVAERSGDTRGVMASLINLGSFNYRGGESARALEFLGRAMAIAERIGDRRGVAACLNNIGSVHLNKGECEAALEDFKQALAIAEKIGDQVGSADNLNNIGVVYREMGDKGRALEYFRIGLALSEKIGNKSKMANCCCGIAEVSLQEGRIEEATDFCGRARELAGESGFKEYLADSKRIFGMICREQGQWEESIDNFEESIRMLKEMKLGKELGEASYEFGLMWKMRGDARRAKELLAEAEAEFGRLNLGKKSEKVKEAMRGLS